MSVFKYRNPSDPSEWLKVPAAGAPGLPSGGSAGQVLIKESSTDYDAGWKPMRTELWTNPDPSVQFAAQTVPVDLSGYSWFIAEFRLVNTIEASRVSVIASAGSATAVTSNTPYNNNLRQFERDMTLNESSVVFGNATTTTEGGNTAAANTLLIPLRIIGLL